MSFLRGTHLTPVTRAFARPTSFRPRASLILQQRTYAEQKTNGAKPKILSESPPDESNASEDVKAHNKEVDRRADRPQEKVKDDEVEKDKVSKGYWQGSQAGANKESP